MNENNTNTANTTKEKYDQIKKAGKPKPKHHSPNHGIKSEDLGTFDHNSFKDNDFDEIEF